jgi:cytochrome b involved in lipid metabolism
VPVCRTVINDRVYDITDFISQHPGGAIILSVAGKDATDFFMELHKVRKGACRNVEVDCAT